MFRRVYMLLLLCLAQVGAAQQPPLRDPMRPYSPPATKKAANSGWRLTNIVRSPDSRVAVLNGQVVREGDTVNGAQVAAIEAWQIRLTRGEKSIVIPLRRSKRSDDIIEREAKP